MSSSKRSTKQPSKGTSKKRAAAPAARKATAPKKTAPRKVTPAKPTSKRGAPKKAGAKKAAPKRAVAKKAAPKPAVAKKPASKQSISKKAAPKRAAKVQSKTGAKTPPRRDGTGHLNAVYARDLHARSGPADTEGRAFVRRGRSSDELAEELAEEAVTAMTSGEDDSIL